MDQHTRRAIVVGLVVVPLGALFLQAVLALAEGLVGSVFGFPMRELMFFANVVLGFYVLVAFLSQRQRRLGESAELMSRLAASNLDMVTGAMARTRFLDEMRDRLRQTKRQGAVFLHVDLDFLKQINDAYGHATGDEILGHLAGTLMRLWPAALVGRLGGDEFGVLVTARTEVGSVGERLAELQRQLNEPVLVAGRSIRVSASVGYARAPDDSPIASELVALADMALYQAKKTRGVAVPFRSDMLLDARARRFLVRELKAAILLDQLEVHYQPVIGVDGVTKTGYEALVRWRHPARGLIAPDVFIPVAEESTLIDDVGDWVLRRVVRDFPALKVPRVGVNVSAVQLRNPAFASRFLAVIAEAGLGTENVVAELTETSLLRDGRNETANLDLLRQSGIRLALDDFGTGFASLQYLREFKADYIKLDKSYVQGAVDNPVDLVFVEAIVAIARSLDLTLLAEGVETERQLELMAKLGCTLFQGYLLGRPQSLEAIEAARAASGLRQSA